MNARAGLAQVPTKPFPDSHTIAHRAAHILFKEGAMLRHDLVAKFEVSKSRDDVQRAINKAIVNGWLVEDTKCCIDISDITLNHLSGFDGNEHQRPEKYIGTPAEPRHIDLMNRPPIGKSITNSKGWRADIPEWSQRDHQSFRSA